MRRRQMPIALGPATGVIGVSRRVRQPTECMRSCAATQAPPRKMRSRSEETTQPLSYLKVRINGPTAPSGNAQRGLFSRRNISNKRDGHVVLVISQKSLQKDVNEVKVIADYLTINNRHLCRQAYEAFALNAVCWLMPPKAANAQCARLKQSRPMVSR